ncbi:MAG: DUF4349 domain-containing protein [Solirubrobacterales bacterium]
MTRPEDDQDRELAALIDEVAAERPEPDPEWAQQLDARVRDGFRRRGAGAWGRFRAPARAARERLGDRPLAFGGVAASMIAAIVVAVGLLGSGGDSETQTLNGESSQLDAPEEALEKFEAGSADRDALEAGGSAAADPGTGAAAPKARKQDRDAQLELRTRPAEVRSVSDQAISIVESVGGVVLNSNLRERGERATAQLRLQVPSGELDPTLDRLTDLATVASLSESVTDITAPFASARDRLKDARAERRKLLQALGSAGDGEEAATLRKQLAKVRNQIARREAAFSRVAQRSRNSEIDLQIKGRTPESSGATAPGGDGNWTIGEAIDDALTVLKAILGALLITTAVLLPLAALALPTRLIYKLVRRRQRQQALAAS